MTRRPTLSEYLSRIALLLVLAVTVFFWATPDGEAARLKDVVDIEGVRENQLVGFGLVVGLNGTGDTSNQAAFTTQSLVMMLERMGISARSFQSQIKVKNVASVMVTAALPPFARQGSKLDITLSSLGDAKSLQGGTLILTPLKGADGKIYAVAQGPLSIGGFEVQGGEATQSKHLTVGRISAGAIVERELPFELGMEKSLQLALKNHDFTTANRIVRAINNVFAQPIAKARDSGTVDLGIPDTYKGRVVEFLARLEGLQVETEVPAKVVVNERTGTIVMGENVRVSTVALAHGNLSVTVQEPPKQLPPKFDADGREIPQTAPGAESTQRLVEMEEGVTLGDLIKGLNNVGATPQDLISILQAIQAAGALQAELKIL